MGGGVAEVNASGSKAKVQDKEEEEADSAPLNDWGIGVFWWELALEATSDTAAPLVLLDFATGVSLSLEGPGAR